MVGVVEKGVTFKGLDICLTLWRKSPNSLSSLMHQSL